MIRVLGEVRVDCLGAPLMSGWCLASAKHHPQQLENSQPYRPDSFTDEVSFE